MNKQPFSSARVTIIEGDQGSGKSVTGVGRVVDKYWNDCVRIFCEEVLKIECQVKAYDRKTRLAKIKYDGFIKIIRIPQGYKLHSPMRIFANFHLYGIPYVYCQNFSQILYMLKHGLIIDGILIIDEAYVGINARAGMSKLGQELEKQSFQYRKMQLEVIIITPMARLIDWTARTIPTEHIICTYDPNTYQVTYTVSKKGQQGNREVTFDARQYFPNYWTNERITA